MSQLCVNHLLDLGSIPPLNINGDHLYMDCLYGNIKYNEDIYMLLLFAEHNVCLLWLWSLMESYNYSHFLLSVSHKALMLTL